MRGYDGWYTGPSSCSKESFSSELSTIQLIHQLKESKEFEHSHPPTKRKQPIESDSDLSRNPPLAYDLSFPATWGQLDPYLSGISLIS